jgi:hypothetical protein
MSISGDDDDGDARSPSSSSPSPLPLPATQPGTRLESGALVTLAVGLGGGVGIALWLVRRALDPLRRSTQRSTRLPSDEIDAPDEKLTEDSVALS